MRKKRAMWFAVAGIALLALIVAALVLHAHRKALVPPWLRISKNTALGEYIIHHNAPYYCSLVWPDGSGHALTWVCQPPRADLYLVQLPEAKVLRWARGFTVISWLRDGTMVGETFIRRPGIPLLNTLPFLQNVKPFAPSSDRVYCEVDWVNCGISPLGQEKWPEQRQTLIWGVAPLQYRIRESAPGAVDLAPVATEEVLAALERSGAEFPGTVTKPLTFRTGKALPAQLRDAVVWDAKLMSANLVTFRVDYPMLLSSLWLANIQTGGIDQLLPLPGALMNPYSGSAAAMLQSTGAL
jgi:hypothetical protein